MYVTTALEYEVPRIDDHGSLTELTASGSPSGHFDANYWYGQPTSGRSQKLLEDAVTTCREARPDYRSVSWALDGRATFTP
jgi:hypothetical protein